MWPHPASRRLDTLAPGTRWHAAPECSIPRGSIPQAARTHVASQLLKGHRRVGGRQVRRAKRARRIHAALGVGGGVAQHHHCGGAAWMGRQQEVGAGAAGVVLSGQQGGRGGQAGQPSRDAAPACAPVSSLVSGWPSTMASVTAAPGARPVTFTAHSASPVAASSHRLPSAAAAPAAPASVTAVKVL